MGLADIWRELDIRTNEFTGEEQEVREKKLSEAIKILVEKFWAKPLHAEKRNLYSRSKKFYDGDQYPGEKRQENQDAEDKRPYIDPIAPYYSLHAEKTIQLLTASESPVLAKPLPDALVDKEVSPQEDLTEVNNLLNAARYSLGWSRYRFRVCKSMVLYGTGYINTLWDGRKGQSKKIPSKDEATGAEKIEIVAEGDVEFEVLHPSQVSLDEECMRFEESRAVLIKRRKTKEQLLTAFKGWERFDELKTHLTEQTKSQGFSSKQNKGKTSDTELSKNEIWLYELLLEPDNRSDFEPEGLHLWAVEGLVIHEEKPDWSSGKRPVVQYLMEEDEESPLGRTRLTQLMGLQMSENQFLNLILQAAENDVALQVLINPSLIDAEDLGNNPKVILQLKPDAAQPSTPLNNAATRLPSSATALGGIIAARNTIAQIREQIGVWYDPKYGFQSGQRRVGELQMLQEEYRNAYSQAVYNAWESDSKVWAAYYEKMDQNVRDPRVLSYLNEQGERKRFKVSRVPVFEKEVSKGKTEKHKLDFVVASKNLPEPLGIKIEKLLKYYELGIYGQPGSPQAVISIRRILKHWGELPEDPKGERYGEAAKVLTQWLDEIGTNPPLLDTKPLVNPFWDHAAMYEELEKWFAVRTVGMTVEQLQGYVYIMGKIEDTAQQRQLEQGAKQIRMQQILAALAGVNSGETPTDQNPPRPLPGQGDVP